MNKIIFYSLIKCLLFAISTLLYVSSAAAQVASSSPYTLEQSVIASGGGESSGGGNFKIEGTIGQAAAGTNSTNNPFAVKGGFWTYQALAPTAAFVTVGGRVLTSEGIGLRNARVILTDFRGSIRTALSSSFGYYKFEDVEVGQTYVISISSKRYGFAPQILTVVEDVENLDFTAQMLGEK